MEIIDQEELPEELLEQPESQEIKNILIKNYLYEIIYLAFGYINLDNDINSELIISLQNLALYLDSYQNDINNDENYDKNYKSELLINIKIAIQVINNFVKKFLDILYPNEQLVDLSPPLLKDDELINEQEENQEMDEQENQEMDEQQNEEMDKQEDDELMDEPPEESDTSSMQKGGTNINNFQSNIDDLIENKYFDLNIENTINNVIDDQNIIHISKKRQKQQDGGANILFNKEEINNLIDIYSKKILSNIEELTFFFIQDQSNNYFIEDLSKNINIVKEIDTFIDNFNKFKNEVYANINNKLLTYIDELMKYIWLLGFNIRSQLNIKTLKNIEIGLLQVSRTVVSNNFNKDPDNYNINIPVLNNLFVDKNENNLAFKGIINATNDILNELIYIHDVKINLLNEKASEQQKKAKLDAKRAALAAKQKIDTINQDQTFITRIQERKMANNILIFIGKTIKNLLKPLYTDSNIIEGKQFQLLNNYADISFNSVDKNVYGKLEESLLNLFQNSNYDFANQLQDLSLNIYNPNTLSKCYYINNAAQGTFGDGSELQQYRYCPLGSLIDAAALRFGGCTYNSPIGKKVTPPDNNENYIETGDINIKFNCLNNKYEYELIINKSGNTSKYQILMNYKLDSHEFQTNYIHDINDSSISASNIYKNLLDLFITTLKQNPTYKKWSNFTSNIEFQKKFLAESTKKGLGDFLQTVNTVFKNGGFITNNQNYSRGAKIIKFDNNGDAPRLNLATDQISSSLLLYIANFFPQQNINKYCWGGYKSSSKLLIKKMPTDINSFTGGRRRTLKKYKNIKKQTKKNKKLKKSNKMNIKNKK